MSSKPTASAYHRAGRNECVCDYYLHGEGPSVCQMHAMTTSGSNAKRGVNKTKRGVGCNLDADDPGATGRRLRRSITDFLYLDDLGTATSKDDVIENGGVMLRTSPGGSGGGGRGRGRGRGGRGGGGGRRPSVHPWQSMSTVYYQIAPQLPLIRSKASADAARTPEQRAILNDPVLSTLYRVHTFGGGLVSIFATVAMNAFVGLRSTVLPGGRVGNKGVVEYDALVAGAIYGNARATDKAFMHYRSRVQDHAVVGCEAWIDQETWIGGKVTVGGEMNIITDSSGHLILGGFGDVVGSFDIVGCGKLMLASAAYHVPRQIEDYVSSLRP